LEITAETGEKREAKSVAAGFFFPAFGFEQADTLIQTEGGFHVVEAAVHFGAKRIDFLVES
jgi:hypothetical protein